MGNGLSSMPVIGDIKQGIELGYKHNRKHIFINCPQCGLTRWIQYDRYRKGLTKCFSCSMKSCIRSCREQHHKWKGGRINMKGYIRIKIYPDNPYFAMADDKGLILEHRLVMAQHLGRVLETKEFVHHKNGIRDDNRFDNLELKMDGQHMKEHSLGYNDGYRQGYKDAQGHFAINHSTGIDAEWSMTPGDLKELKRWEHMVKQVL